MFLCVAFVWQDSMLKREGKDCIREGSKERAVLVWCGCSRDGGRMNWWLREAWESLAACAMENSHTLSHLWIWMDWSESLYNTLKYCHLVSGPLGLNQFSENTPRVSVNVKDQSAPCALPLFVHASAHMSFFLSLSFISVSPSPTVSVLFSICSQAHSRHFTHQKIAHLRGAVERISALLFLLPLLYALHQVSCVINNFQQTQRAMAMATSPPPQRPEPPIGLPLLSLPRVESPLEKLSGLQVRVGENNLEKHWKNSCCFSLKSTFGEQILISHVSDMAAGMSLHHFGPKWNISTAIGHSGFPEDESCWLLWSSDFCPCTTVKLTFIVLS